MTINETTNYKIKKPTPDEYYDIALNNENADIIDGAIKINADAIATKQAIITGGASTIASANLPFKKAVVTDSTGKITVADVTDLELGYVKGVTGALQTQINTKASASGLNSHTGDAVAHITAGERSAWNALPTDANFTAHVTDSVKHITGTERTAWNAKTDDTALNSHKSDSVHIQTGERTKWNNKTDDTTVDAHVLDTGRHVTAGDKTNWNSKTDNTALNSHKGDSTHITGAERILWTGKTDDTVVNSHAGNGDIHVTKALKAGWTAKADVSDITGAVSTHAGLNTHITEDERTAWNALPTDANFTAHVTDSVKHITGTERTAWNAKETPSGAQSKATTALNSAKSYVDGKVKTDVPVGAIFTDNNTVTSINGKTGVITKADIVALGIPAQDTVVNISGKVDVEAGKGLSTNDYTTVEKNKLAGLSNYTHPSTHPASMITESTTKRFVTDAEKTAWNAKTTDANLIIHEADAVKHITSSERATWNNKVNISTGGVHKNKFVQTDADGNIKKFDTIQSADVPVHSAGLLTSGTIPSGRIGLDIGRASDLTTHAGLSTHISSTERTKWNTVTDKADTSAMNSALDRKADTTALNAHTIDKANPHSVTKAQIGLGSVDNTSDINKPISTATQTALDGTVKKTGMETIEGDKFFAGRVTILKESTVKMRGNPQSLDIVNKEYLDSRLTSKQDGLTFDDAPVSGSTNPVKSGGVHSALASKANIGDSIITGDRVMPYSSIARDTWRQCRDSHMSNFVTALVSHQNFTIRISITGALALTLFVEITPWWWGTRTGPIAFWFLKTGIIECPLSMA